MQIYLFSTGYGYRAYFDHIYFNKQIALNKYLKLTVWNVDIFQGTENINSKNNNIKTIQVDLIGHFQSIAF